MSTDVQINPNTRTVVGASPMAECILEAALVPTTTHVMIVNTILKMTASIQFQVIVMVVVDVLVMSTDVQINPNTRTVVGVSPMADCTLVVALVLTTTHVMIVNTILKMTAGVQFQVVKQ